MQDQLASLAYHGQWDSMLSLLRQYPDLVNAASSGKGYTALHQAAWHGADIPVLGALLALGASPRLMTRKHETASDIRSASTCTTCLRLRCAAFRSCSAS